MQEVEAVCNRVIIINRGKIVADGGIAEVKSGSFNKNQIVFAEFNLPVNQEQIMEIDGVESSVYKDNIWEIESEIGQDIRPALFRFAVNNGLIILTLNEKQQNLEGVFQELTANKK